MLNVLAQRCFDKKQYPYLIKDVISIKDIFERERDIAQLTIGDNVYITAKIRRMTEPSNTTESGYKTELVWIKDIFVNGNDFVLEVGGNRMFSTFNFKTQWLALMSKINRKDSIKNNKWPNFTERSSDVLDLGNQMINWEPPKIEDYRVKSPTLFHYSDPLFAETQEVLEEAYQQSVKSYNTRVNNYYTVLAQACVFGKVVPYHLSQDQIIALISTTKDDADIKQIKLKNMITDQICDFDFFKDIQIIKAYIMHDHFLLHTNIGLITSRNMEELFTK